MANDADKKGLAVVRTFENRIVWSLALAAHLNRGLAADDAAANADKALDEYQTRFPSLTPADLPE